MALKLGFCKGKAEAADLIASPFQARRRKRLLDGRRQTGGLLQRQVGLGHRAEEAAVAPIRVEGEQVERRADHPNTTMNHFTSAPGIRAGGDPTYSSCWRRRAACPRLGGGAHRGRASEARRRRVRAPAAPVCAFNQRERPSAPAPLGPNRGPAPNRESARRVPARSHALR